MTLPANAPEAPRLTALVLGDLCVDLVAAGNLDGRFGGRSGPGQDLTFRTSLREQPGGTAFQFASAAAANRMRPIVMGCVGNDTAGSFLRAALEGAGIEQRVFIAPNHSTARVVLAYDETGRRLMLAERDSANRHLPDVTSGFDGLSDHIDLVWISGVVIADRTTPTFAAIRTILDEARRRGARVVVDVVPHEFHLFYQSISELADALGGLDGLVSEQSSLRRLVSLGRAGEELSLAAIEETARRALRETSLVVVRQRVDDRYHLSAWTRRDGEIAVRDVAAFNDDRMAGRGDRLVCEVLPTLLGLDHWDAGGSDVAEGA